MTSKPKTKPLVIPTAINTWSYSRLVDYESCPLKAFLKHVKRIPDPRPNPHADRGTAIHLLAEEYINGKIETLPIELIKFKDEFESVRARHAKNPDSVLQEQEWGFDREWNITEYRGSNAWGRVKADLITFTNPEEAVAVDFKTGKKFGNELKHGEQLQVYALSSFMRYPALQHVTTELWYLDIDDLSTVEVTRKRALERYLPVFDGRLRKMTDAKTFPAKPNIYSCKYCAFGDTGHCDKRVVDTAASAQFFKNKFGKK